MTAGENTSEDPVVDETSDPEETTEQQHVLSADELADEMSEESFPTSDPPSTWGGDDRG